MTHIQPYLFFPGTCEEALAFYHGVFGGSVTIAMRYKDMPPGVHPSSPDQAEWIMHSTLSSGTVTFMASDSPRLEKGTPAQRVALSISSGDVAEGGRIFDALAAGGTVVQPYAKAFWDATFGMLTDRYGIDWMINAG